MRSKILYGLLFLISLASDQLTKVAIDSQFHLHESRPILGNYLLLTYIRNSGAAFGLKFGEPVVMFVVSIAVILLLVFLYWRGLIRPDTTYGKIGFVLIISGAAGNMIDRIRLGEVIDFIEMGVGRFRWPVYNLADIYVTIGMLLLLVTFSIHDRKLPDTQSIVE